MDVDGEKARLTQALLEVAEVELRAGDSMDPVIVLGVDASGTLIAHSHLRRRPGASGLFPFDTAPARRSLRASGALWFGIAYGIWQDRVTGPVAEPTGNSLFQAGLVTIVGGAGGVETVLHGIAWDKGRFAGFGERRVLPQAPVDDLTGDDPADGLVIPLF